MRVVFFLMLNDTCCLFPLDFLLSLVVALLLALWSRLDFDLFDFFFDDDLFDCCYDFFFEDFLGVVFDWALDFAAMGVPVRGIFFVCVPPPPAFFDLVMAESLSSVDCSRRCTNETFHRLWLGQNAWVLNSGPHNYRQQQATTIRNELTWKAQKTRSI